VAKGGVNAVKQTCKKTDKGMNDFRGEQTNRFITLNEENGGRLRGDRKYWERRIIQMRKLPQAIEIKQQQRIKE